MCLADALLRFSRSVMRRLKCPSDVELFYPHENPQQRSGNGVERHLVILDAAAGMGDTASTVPLPIVTIRHPHPPPDFAAERRCGRGRSTCPAVSNPRARIGLGLSGYNWDTAHGVLIHKSLIYSHENARLEPSPEAVIRRDKAALSSGCKPRPATAPAGSSRSRHGGDEMSEAFG
jgi:hypothetical protein